MEAAIKTPFRQRINFRILIFAAFFGAVIGYPIYVYVDSIVSGGVRDLGNGVLEVDLKAMSTFPFDQSTGKTEDVPEKWRKLDGQRVVLKGEMVPPSMSARGGVGRFELVYSVQKCCFSGPPQIQHFVQCSVASNREVDYWTGLVRVVGTLRVEARRDAETGAITGLYHLEVEQLRPVE